MHLVKNAKWSNWSGAHNCHPSIMLYPHSIEELANYIKNTDSKQIRIVGSAHSFSPIVPTNDLLISLDNLQGILSIENNVVEVLAGTKLHLLAKELHDSGVALINMGDIDRQSIAGAMCTGTHGTGASLSILSDSIIEFSFINSQGEIVTCSENENPNIFKLARVNLGMIGVVVKYKLKVTKAYKLHFTSQKNSFQQCLDSLDRKYKDNRHFELFWFPHTDVVQERCSNITDKEVREKSKIKYLLDEFLENNVFNFISSIARLFPTLSPTIAKICGFFIGTENRINYSHKIFANLRDVKFQEMEIAIDVKDTAKVLRLIDKTIREQKINVHFPIEIRFCKSDDIALSPCYQRESCFIAFHMFKGMPYEDYFKLMQKTLAPFNPRAHWGKMSFSTKEQYAQLYPLYNDFIQLRKNLDPQGIFLNVWLKERFQ